MVYSTQNYCFFFLLCQSSCILKIENTKFGELDLFPSSGVRETPILLGPLEEPIFNQDLTSIIGE
jgi:hypothetical protein